MSRPSSSRPSLGPRLPRRGSGAGDDDGPEPFSGIAPHTDLIPDALRAMGPKDLATMRMVSTEYRAKVDLVVRERIQKAKLVDTDGNPVTSSDWVTFGRWMHGALYPYNDYLVDKWDHELSLSKAYAPETQAAFVRKLMKPPSDAELEQVAAKQDELHKYANLLLAAGRVIRLDGTPIDLTTPTTNVLAGVSEGTIRLLPKPPP